MMEKISKEEMKNKYFPININTLLGFIGYKAVIKDNDQVDIYDIENNTLYTTCTITEYDKGWKIEFNNKNGEKVTFRTYYFLNSKAIINDSIQIGLKSVEIGGNDDHYDRINIEYFDYEKEFGYKKLFFGGALSAFISTPSLGIYRGFSFNDDNGYYDEMEMYEIAQLTSNKEITFKEGSHCYYLNLDGNHKIVKPTNEKSRYNNIKNLARHPRNIETIRYILDETEMNFPGITEFIEENFKIYDMVLGEEYDYDEQMESLVERIHCPECDLKEQKKKVM